MKMAWEHCMFYSKSKHEGNLIKVVITLQKVKKRI